MKFTVCTAVIVTLAAAPAFAQADNKACAQQRTTVGTGDQPLSVENKNGKETTLSDKLARSDGVICPPSDVDADIKAPTPGGGRIQVIPPPGTPQNQPNVQPK